MLKTLFLLLFTLFLSCNTKNEDNDLKHWTYKIESKLKPSNDSIKPIGRIEFWRTKPVEDKQREGIYKKEWIPSIEFKIYKLSDFKYCERKSNQTKIISSCTGAGVGGDLIAVKSHIFLNNSVCVNCIKEDTDFCRPTVIKLLSALDLTENSTLEEIDKKIGMKIKRTKKSQ